MTPILYPNSRDPRTAVKTERTKVPVNVWSTNTHKETHRERGKQNSECKDNNGKYTRA